MADFDSVKDKTIGKVKEAAGKVSGKGALEAKGKVQQLKGEAKAKADELKDQAAAKINQAVDKVKED